MILKLKLQGGLGAACRLTVDEAEHLCELRFAERAQVHAAVVVDVGGAEVDQVGVAGAADTVGWLEVPAGVTGKRAVSHYISIA